jgi:hypothetical protein
MWTDSALLGENAPERIHSNSYATAQMDSRWAKATKDLLSEHQQKLKLPGGGLGW